MKHLYRRHRTNTRPANVLVGCLVAIAIVVILAIIAVIYVAMTWRGYMSGWAKQGVVAVLVESRIEQDEQDEIMVHIDTLMTRFENKEVTFKQLSSVIEELTESSVPAAAMVISIDRIYLAESALEDSEKAQGRIELARFGQGLFDKTIPEDSLHDVLKPVTTTTPDNNDIRLNLTLGNNNQQITALRSADEVSDDELRELIATAKAKADEAGITETPSPIDLSDEIGTAIANALEEDPNEWIGLDHHEDSADDVIVPAIEPTTEPAIDPTDPDGP